MQFASFNTPSWKIQTAICKVNWPSLIEFRIHAFEPNTNQLNIRNLGPKVCRLIMYPIWPNSAIIHFYVISFTLHL
jgi:hypothetical protein